MIFQFMVLPNVLVARIFKPIANKYHTGLDGSNYGSFAMELISFLRRVISSSELITNKPNICLWNA